MYKLLTQRDIAERWQLSVRAVEDCRKAGLITAVNGVPRIRFNPQHIEELEGTKLERFSPFERKRLEIENEGLRQTNEKYKAIITKIVAAGAEIFTLKDSIK